MLVIGGGRRSGISFFLYVHEELNCIFSGEKSFHLYSFSLVSYHNMCVCLQMCIHHTYKFSMKKKKDKKHSDKGKVISNLQISWE